MMSLRKGDFTVNETLPAQPVRADGDAAGITEKDLSHEEQNTFRIEQYNHTHRCQNDADPDADHRNGRTDGISGGGFC